MTQGHARQLHLLRSFTKEGHNCVPTWLVLRDGTLEVWDPKTPEEKAKAFRALREPGLVSKGPNLLLDLDLGILKLGPSGI